MCVCVCDIINKVSGTDIRSAQQKETCFNILCCVLTWEFNLLLLSVPAASSPPLPPSVSMGPTNMMEGTAACVLLVRLHGVRFSDLHLISRISRSGLTARAARWCGG